MEFKELIALVNAGFSKDEIKAIVTAKTKEPEPQPAQQTAPDTEPEKIEEPSAAEQAAAGPALDLSELKAAIDDLKKTIQASNILNNTSMEAPAASVQDAADDVIKRMINPSGK